MHDKILAAVDEGLDGSIDRLLELVTIPSISTDPAYARHCQDAADWLVAMLTELGFTADTRATAGHPVVLARTGGDHRRMLFYGHYDVQPVDPLDRWSRPPFDAAVIDAPYGRAIHGRGASDDKGQFMTFIEACRAWKVVNGALPEGLTLLLEGEEECGSVSLAPFLRENRDALKADLAIICDTGLFASRTPAIMTSLRGLMAEEIVIEGPAIDLHSGLYGGVAVNPLRVLSGILASLHDETNRIAIPEFYRDVRPRDTGQVAAWSELDFSTEDFLGQIGLRHPVGEDGMSVLESLWTRPTCEINGMQGGYTGEGFKTVLPARASAKISFRLVADQDPAHLRSSFRNFVQTQIPEDCQLSFTSFASEKACLVNTSSPLFALAAEELTAEWQETTVMTGSGGSIPVTGMLQEILGMDALLAGFGRDDDAIHSPDERYGLANYHRGIRSWARILNRSATLARL